MRSGEEPALVLAYFSFGGRGDPLWASPISPSARGRTVSEWVARASSKTRLKLSACSPPLGGGDGRSPEGVASPTYSRAFPKTGTLARPIMSKESRMNPRTFLHLWPLLATCAPAFATPKTPVARPATDGFHMAEDPLEARWSYRAKIDATGTGSAAWLLGREVVALQPSGIGLKGTFSNPQRKEITPFFIPSRLGELGLVRVGRTLSVLWDGRVCARLAGDLGGDAFGTKISGAWKQREATYQPTEPVVFRDDFMRASGPDSPDVPGDWNVKGNWKTSGTLGPLADASLSPNPFVFRASGTGEQIAKAGKWFWNNYSVSASVRAVGNEGDKTPLMAGLSAFCSSNGGEICAEVDFRTGVARIVERSAQGLSPVQLFNSQGRLGKGVLYASIIIPEKVLAESAPFDAGIGQWHRLKLEPKNGEVALYFDGREVARARCDLMQGEIALRAKTSDANYIDFDDVRVGAPEQNGQNFGEGALPDRLVKDRLMKNWASAASAWKRDAKGVWWHTGDFWNDASLEVPLPKLEEGQGFRFYLRSNSENSARSAMKVFIERRGGKIQWTLSNGKPIALSDNSNNTIRLHLALLPKDSLSDVIYWNGNAVGASVIYTDGHFGTKIGIEPLQNGAPLPPPGVQNLSLQAPTRLREGQSVIGVNISDVTPAIASQLGLPDASGVVIDHVEDGSPAQTAGFQSGDIVRGVNGGRVINIETMRALVGSVRAPSPVTLAILRPQHDASNLDWASCLATSANQLDYAFTSAPTDWIPARGQWEVSERWTCSPQWSFFAGTGDEFPLLWSRFATKGDWTLEAYLATPMDLTRGERSPMDLNLSVGDGKRVSSGYSFAFAARNRESNLIWRANSVVKTTPFEMPPGAGDTHQDWFYVRLERRRTPRGVRFTWSVNGKPAGDYEDTHPISGANRLAFWTKNGAISLARVRLWHEGLATLPLQPRPQNPQFAPIPNPFGAFSVRDAGPNASAKLSLVAAQGAKTIEIENPRDGGDWTTYLSRESFDPAQRNGIISFDYRVGSDVKLNLYALVGGEWREIAWTGGAASPDTNQRVVGAIENVVADDAWQRARFDLRTALARNGLAGQSVDALAFAAPSRDYLRQGLGGNPMGAHFSLRNLQTFPSPIVRDVSAK